MILKKLKIIILNFIILQFLILNVCEATQMQEDYIRVVLNENDKILNHIEEPQNPQIYSESAILVEEKTGKILYEKNIYDRKYPASTTKILTAIIALERCDLREFEKASPQAINSIKSGYSTANIQIGETFTIEQLLDVMMIHSANEAANIIAEHISGSVSEFAKLMNEKAKEIGCLDSNFVNPNGMHDENHYSTAYDMAQIARYCMKNEKFREIVTKMECSLPTTDLWQEERVFKNTNSLMIPGHKYYYQYCNGIKTGFTTPAKNCLIASSNKEGFEVISVVLHAESTPEGLSARYLDTINLFEYGYNNYNLNDILEEYDLIEYDENNQNTKSMVGSVYSNGVEININNKFNYKDWIKIIVGVVIILLVFLYYILQKILKIKKTKLLCTKY